MKHSIKNIFNNLSLLLLSAAIFAGLGALVSIEHTNAYAKIDNLNNQKQIISSLTKLPKDDIELALIQFNGKSTQLHGDIRKLRQMYKYSFVERYLLLNSKEYLSDLDKLSSLTTSFNEKASNYYTSDNNETTKEKKELNRSFYSLYKQIDSIIFKSIEYNKAKFNIHKSMALIAFVVISLIAVWYRKRLKLIYKDLEFLYNADKKNDSIFTKEVDAISLRMKRKFVTSDNPAMLDPVTGINNLKGMMSSYAEKKGMKESNFTSLTIIEVDNFSKSNRIYSQEFTQNILKKIAFTISLHEQSADVIARTDYNQFTIILSRASKEQSFKDIEIIRQSISELKLKSQETGSVKVTVSGGFVIKPNNATLDEALRDAKKVLLYAQKSGTNKIFQKRDLPES
ncbi:MAG: GGDEF domain-containing protein [Sulfurimonas sp.]|nr:GGDEF domain-containing protein [Sulfurimonas sp.]